MSLFSAAVSSTDFTRYYLNVSSIYYRHNNQKLVL